jgi:protein-L-isoaspartate(D-aspartate) O-methyltransferase
VPPAARDLAYLDRSLKLDGPSGRALLTPMVSARMIQSLDLKGGERVLDYAGGTGYTAAILSHLGAEVTLVEPDSGLAARAHATLASLGMASVTVAETLAGLTGEFDAILVNGACDEAPSVLLDRLGEGGRAIFVQGQGRSGRVMLAQKAGGRVSLRTIFDAAVPLLPEFAAKPAFAL